ncbi:hypothetical protein [Streptomyces pseudovenezuelae]|uniref:Peptidase inhibitor family I36 n=1 Tax=Streptomyces pseudovenezuelae TaxID=67350 RepID=A0ABT6LZQ6_9ACTN|nr:hypothetical protein [Streptomyces pseudovenezuelae]MDH6221792.1 hypothetical protein [Streptomyces pseudovenezuelae]
MALRKIVAVALASLALAGAGLTTPASAASAAPSSQADCPAGYGCLYKGGSWNSVPFTYYHYGYYNLTGVSGTWRAYNHQTGGATMALCYGLNGTNCLIVLSENQWRDQPFMQDFKSIVLAK